MISKRNLALISMFATATSIISIVEAKEVDTPDFNSRDKITQISDASELRRIEFPSLEGVSNKAPGDYHPRMYLNDGVLTICSADGVFIYDIAEQSWETALQRQIISNLVRTDTHCFYVRRDENGGGKVYRSDLNLSDGEIKELQANYLTDVSPDALGIYKDPFSNHLYVAGKDGNTYESTDEGETWPVDHYQEVTSRLATEFSPYMKDMIYQSYQSYLGWMSVVYGLTMTYSGCGFSFKLIGGDSMEYFYDNNFITRFSFPANDINKAWFGGNGIVGYVIPAERGEKSNGEYYVSYPSEKKSIFAGVVVDKENKDVVYAPTVVCGDEGESNSLVIYKTENGGVSWHSVLDMEVPQEVNEVIDALEHDGAIYIYTTGKGLFEYRL